MPLQKIKKWLGNKDHSILELLKKSTSFLITNLLGIAVLFGFSFWISRNYGAATWGQFALTLTIIQLLATASVLGLNLYVVKYGAEYKSKGELGRLKNLLGKSFGFILLTALTLSSLLYYFAEDVAVNILNNPELVTNVRYACFGVPLFAILTLELGVLRGLKKIRDFGLFKNVYVWLGTFIYFTILLGTGHFSVAEATVIAYISSLATLIVLILIPINKGEGLIKVPSEKSRDSRSILKASFPLFFVALMHNLNIGIDKVVITSLLDIRDVGIYDVAIRINALTGLVIMAVNAISMPVFSELFANKKLEKLRQYAINSSKIIFWASLPALLILLIFPGPILGIFGEEFREGRMVLATLAMGQIICIMMGSAEILLQMTDNQNVFQNVFIVSTLVTVISMFVLIPAFGLVGAAIAKITGVIFWRTSAMFIARKKLNVSTFYFPGITK